MGSGRLWGVHGVEWVFGRCVSSMTSERLLQAKTIFRYVRKAVAAMADAKPLNVQDDSNASTGPTDGSSSVGSRGRSGSESKFFTPTSCVPFIGMFLLLPGAMYTY